MSRCTKTGKVKFPKVRSVIGQYIRGEKSLQDIVHPSKLTKISRYESQSRQNRSVLRSQRVASPGRLKSAESYPADPIVTTIESEEDDGGVDSVRFIDSNALCRMGDSLAVRGVSLNNKPIWPTSSSPPPLPSASTRLSRRSRAKINDENTRIGSQAEQLAAMATTNAKTFLVDGHQNLSTSRQPIEIDRQSIGANTCNSNASRTRSKLRLPRPASIKHEPETIRRIRKSCRSIDFSPFIDQQFSGSCDSSGTTSMADSFECFAENVNPSSDSSAGTENPQCSDFKTPSAGSSEDDETTELEIGKRYLEEKIDRQRAQIDELNDEIKKARHIRDDYIAAAAKVVTKSEFENVLREFLNSSESWIQSDNISNVSSDSAIKDYFTKCYDDLRRKVQQCDGQLKVSNMLVDKLEKDKNRLQNHIVELENIRTNGTNVPLAVH